MPNAILLVDDDEKLLRSIAEVVHHYGYTLYTARNGNDARELFKKHSVGVVLLDINLPDVSGEELLQEFVRQKPMTSVVMISGFGTIERAVKCTKWGAYDFLEKPLEPQRVLTTVRNAMQKFHLEAAQQTLVEEMLKHYGIVGVSEVMKKIYSDASRIAKYDTPVLITGESGTGKECLAQLIHRLSGRASFVPFNCAAVPQELIESELFGHTKGAFTGATSDKQGKFQLADNGTLFLDEIGDMSLNMQSKILRALETKDVSKVGGNETERVNARCIAATNKNLSSEIRNGKFREDLLYRLRGITFHLPPLRERRDDIPHLARYFLSEWCKKNKTEHKRLSERTEHIVQEQDWRGNVRELKYVVETLAMYSDNETIDHIQTQSLLASLDEPQFSSLDYRTYQQSLPLHEALEHFEKNLIQQSLLETQGNISHAAEKLHIDRAHLSKKIKRFGLK